MFKPTILKEEYERDDDGKTVIYTRLQRLGWKVWTIKIYSHPHRTTAQILLREQVIHTLTSPRTPPSLYRSKGKIHEASFKLDALELMQHVKDKFGYWGHII